MPEQKKNHNSIKRRPRGARSRGAFCRMWPDEDGSGGFSAGRELVGGHGDDDDEADHDELEVRGDAEQGKPVSNECDEQRADHGAEHGATSAGGGAAADDAGRDDVEFEGDAGGGLG